MDFIQWSEKFCNSVEMNPKILGFIISSIFYAKEFGTFGKFLQKCETKMSGNTATPHMRQKTESLVSFILLNESASE